MIRDNKDVCIITRASRPMTMTPDEYPLIDKLQYLALCGAFNTETGKGVAVFCPANANGEVPAYVLLGDSAVWNKGERATITLAEGFTPSFSSEERKYIRSVEKIYRDSRREVEDVFGANGPIGLARAWVRLGMAKIFGPQVLANRRDREIPALPQRTTLDGPTEP